MYIHNVKQRTQSAVRILKTHNSLKRQLCVNLATSVLLGKDRHRVIRARDHHLCRLPPKCESMQIHANPLNASEYICLSTTNWCKMEEKSHKMSQETMTKGSTILPLALDPWCVVLCASRNQSNVALWNYDLMLAHSAAFPIVLKQFSTQLWEGSAGLQSALTYFELGTVLLQEIWVGLLHVYPSSVKACI